MRALRAHHRLDVLLKVAGLARGTFYCQAKIAVAPDRDVPTRQRIQQIYTEHHGCYGYRRITEVLRQSGQVINHEAVQRLMGTLGLRSLNDRKGVQDACPF